MTSNAEGKQQDDMENETKESFNMRFIMIQNRIANKATSLFLIDLRDNPIAINLKQEAIKIWYRELIETINSEVENLLEELKGAPEK